MAESKVKNVSGASIRNRIVSETLRSKAKSLQNKGLYDQITKIKNSGQICRRANVG